VVVQSLWWLGFGWTTGESVQFPLRLEISLLHSIHTGCEHIQPSTGGLFPRVKPQGREAARWFPCIAEVKSEMNCRVRVLGLRVWKEFHKLPLLLTGAVHADINSTANYSPLNKVVLPLCSHTACSNQMFSNSVPLHVH